MRSFAALSLLSQARLAQMILIVLVGSLSATVFAEEATGLTPEQLKAAAEDFHLHCAVCHGTTGRGNGPMARAMKITPPDLTKIAKRHGGIFPEARVFRTISGVGMPISHGTRDMPLWADFFIRETLKEGASAEDAERLSGAVKERIDRLVKYVQTLQVTK
jgi:mono/diheme cytochrome c family protein